MTPMHTWEPLWESSCHLDEWVVHQATTGGGNYLGHDALEAPEKVGKAVARFQLMNAYVKPGVEGVECCLALVDTGLNALGCTLVPIVP